MINLTANDIVFNVSGTELSNAVANSLETAAEQILVANNLQNIDLGTVTTKTNIRAAFPKFVRGRVLKDRHRLFDESYVQMAFHAYKQKHGHYNKGLFNAVMFADESGPFSYKASYAQAVKLGLGMFLVALHSSGAVTLPATLPWPSAREEGLTKRRKEIGIHVASELLAFVRRLDSQSEVLPHPAFKAIGGDRKRREWFLTYATKLLLATGWHKPEDANIEDLLRIKKAESAISGKVSMPLAYTALLDVLNAAFPDRIKVTSAAWSETLGIGLSKIVKFEGGKTSVAKEEKKLVEEETLADPDLLDQALNLPPAWGKPTRVKGLERLPGLGVDFKSLSKLWLDLEELYIRKTSRESYKGIDAAFGWWNSYLFYYLPYWFERNPDTHLTYPSSPALVVKSVFVSRLLPSDEERPITFIEYLNAQAKNRSWKGNTHYAHLLQLQGFFEFIELYSEEMPGCNGFVQPLAAHDYPKTSRPVATKKQPVPRRFFGVYLDYHEALLAYHRVVLEKVLTEELTTDQLTKLGTNVIDTFATSDLVGFIPLLFTKAKTLRLQFIPNVLNIRSRTVKGGRSLSLPHPHGLHQNLVALHTGIRHNHLQWLDRDKFDSKVDEDDVEFALLYVNTDKQRSEPWTPHVNFRVIELLRAQREWCELIEEPEFHVHHFYNNNPQTKWPKFRPLFAYGYEGLPHSDNRYTETWQATLCGLQGLMQELTEFGRGRQLLHLLPPNHNPRDSNLSKNLAAFGAKFQMGDSCPLRVTSDITPHSARVAVVSQYISFLPTDLIGKYLTGQHKGVVSYYVHLDEETIKAQQVHQAARMRDAVLRSAFEPALGGGAFSTVHLHADSVNSSLSRSLRANVEETIISHGGMSISFMEKGKRGVDILRESGCADVAFNKTEVCPYGNNCPRDVVHELKGLRRCGLCPYAVRFIDHLPAVLAKKRQVAENVDQLEVILAMDAKSLNAKYSAEELDNLEGERARLCEDLTGWTLNEEVLELMRQRIAAGLDTRTWTVQRPEIIEKDLKRVTVQTSASEYLLARLGECIAFPVLESPQVRARFDLLRRELLARAGNLRAAFAPSIPADPAAECAGLLRSVVTATGLDAVQVAKLLEQNIHLENLPKSDLRLLSTEENG